MDWEETVGMTYARHVVAVVANCLRRHVVRSGHGRVTDAEKTSQMIECVPTM